MPNEAAMLMTQGIDKIEELRGEVAHLREVIRMMAAAEADCDGNAVQAMAREVLKRK